MQWLKNNPSSPATLINELVENHYQDLGRTEFSLLPELTDAELNDYLTQQNADEFSRTPTSQNHCYDTSCLNRQQSHPLIADLLQNYGNGLLTRLATRLCELANLPDLIRKNMAEIRTDSPLRDCQSYASATGLAQVQTSRGLLIHRVELKQSIIKNYQIIAPTEWNFHPQGIAALSLQKPTKILLQQQASLMINALDPCVAFDVFIEKEAKL